MPCYAKGLLASTFSKMPKVGGPEGFQKATGKPFGRARRREIPCKTKMNLQKMPKVWGRRSPEGDRKALWSRPQARNPRKTKTNLQKMPKVWGRRFPKGDRKALWSRRSFRFRSFEWHRKVATRLDLSEKGQPCRRETPCQTKTNLPKDSYRRGPKVPKGTVGHSRRTGCLFPGKRHQPRGCGKPFQLRHICSASRASGDESPAACSACLSS